MTEQAKFTYSPLGKALGKALKPKELKPKETKSIEYDNYFINGLAEIRDFTKTIDFHNLTYSFTGDSAPISFIGFKGP